MSTYVIYLVVTAAISGLGMFFASPLEKEAELKITWFGTFMKLLSGFGVDAPKIVSALKDLAVLAGAAFKK